MTENKDKNRKRKLLLLAEEKEFAASLLLVGSFCSDAVNFEGLYESETEAEEIKVSESVESKFLNKH